jgi:hypothetical protein
MSLGDHYNRVAVVYGRLMLKRGWFSSMFDSDWKQRQDLYEAEDDINFLKNYAANVDGNVNVLRMQVVRLAKTVEILIDMLEDKGHLDEERLQERVEAAFAPPPPRTAPIAHAGGDPYRSMPAETAQRPVAKTICIRCNANVPVTMTTLTETGAMCDHCFINR